MPATPIALTPAEFEQLARDAFALVQRDRTEANIDVVALTGKALSSQEVTHIRRLLALYFGELAGHAVDEQTAPRQLEPEIMRDWMRQHLRSAA